MIIFAFMAEFELNKKVTPKQTNMKTGWCFITRVKFEINVTLKQKHSVIQKSVLRSCKFLRT